MRSALFFFILVIATMVGCDQSTTSTGPATDRPEQAKNIQLTVGSIDEFNKLLADNKGKVILVDFWATWCGPCVENFPHTVELAHRYEGEGLVTIAVSLDDPDNEANVRAFLAAQDNVSFDNLLSKDGGGQKTAEAFGLSGAVPHYRLYNRAGEMVMAEDGLPDDLEQRIKELLAAQ